VSDVQKAEKEAREKAQKEQERQDREYDLALLKKAEAALAEIDRTAGLINRHADVLAALRIRIEGGPRKSLEDLMSAAGEIRGKKDELSAKLKAEESRKKGDLGDLLAREPRKKKSLDDLLGEG
jgi:hypothetical protein